ncbi:hypothetical protein [Enterobacter kobei]|uniref:hypothetical protein n=1 Tax=Enterobacter kobei TaxID=208224 RepID=UPI003F5150EF
MRQLLRYGLLLPMNAPGCMNLAKSNHYQNYAFLKIQRMQGRCRKPQRSKKSRRWLDGLTAKIETETTGRQRVMRLKLTATG